MDAPEVFAGSALGALEARVADRVALLGREDTVARIWAKDHTVWKPDPTEIADRLGWLDVARDMLPRVRELESFAERVAGEGFTRAVLLGMGGSSLAAEVIRATLGVAPGRLDLTILDTTHPGAIAALERALDLARTLFVVASKSGGTIETRSHFDYFHAKGAPRFAVITDEGSALERLARERGCHDVFVNPADIGGRYSALSLFGLVPGALIGADVRSLLESAEETAEACRRPAGENPGAWLGAVMGVAARAGRDKCTVLVPEEAASFGAWAEQLVAESTGKEGKGVVPVVGEPLGPPETYGEDRIFVSLGDHPGLEAVSRAGHPVLRMAFDGPKSLGALFFMFEFAVPVAGAVLGIHPFDQPNVAEAKEATGDILAAGDVDDPGADDPGALLGQVRPGDYVAIQAYLDPSPVVGDRLQRVRMTLRDRYRVATTVGFGPRFLHSTGQLHKGGADNVVCVQVVEPGRDADLGVPGQPFTFGRLLDAQALGDLRSLRRRGRRVARTTLERLEAATA